MKELLKPWKKYSYLILFAFIIGGIFDLRIGLIALICMVGPIALSILRGRMWCGNICPRGSFYDNIVFKFSKNRKVPKLFKSVYFRSAVTFFMLTMFTLGFITNWGNLYGMGFVIYRLIVVTTLIGIVLSLFYNQRAWCSFCPMGSIAALISNFRNKKNSRLLLKVNSSCVYCKLCERTCPMGITPYSYKGNGIEHPECIQCNRCVHACPKKSIGYNK